MRFSAFLCLSFFKYRMRWLISKELKWHPAYCKHSKKKKKLLLLELILSLLFFSNPNLFFSCIFLPTNLALYCFSPKTKLPLLSCRFLLLFLKDAMQHAYIIALPRLCLHWPPIKLSKSVLSFEGVEEACTFIQDPPLTAWRWVSHWSRLRIDYLMYKLGIRDTVTLAHHED